jgi:hypothetical protein
LFSKAQACFVCRLQTLGQFAIKPLTSVIPSAAKNLGSRACSDSRGKHTEMFRFTQHDSVIHDSGVAQ